MNGPGEKLLARAALAVDQHGRVRRRYLLDLRRDLLERSAFADDGGHAQTVGELLPEQDVLRRDAGGVESALDQHEQMVGVEGLGQKIVGPLLDRLDRDLDRAEGGHDDDRQERIFLLHGLEHFEAVLFRQFQVGQHETDALVGQLSDPLGSVPAPAITW